MNTIRKHKSQYFSQSEYSLGVYIPHFPAISQIPTFCLLEYGIVQQYLCKSEALQSLHFQYSSLSLTSENLLQDDR